MLLLLAHFEPRGAVGLGLLLLVLLLARLAGLLASFLAVALRLVVVPSVVVLGQRGRGRCGRQENGEDELTHDSDFLWFPEAGSAPHQMSGG